MINVIERNSLITARFYYPFFTYHFENIVVTGSQGLSMLMENVSK
jgi:hypothetical protein